MPDPCGLVPCRCKEIWERYKQGGEGCTGLALLTWTNTETIARVLVSESRKEAWIEACEATQDILECCWKNGTLHQFGTVCALIDALAERGPEE